MAIFEFSQEFLDVRKVTEYFEIEADSLEEAKAMVKKVSNLQDIEYAELVDSKDDTDWDNPYDAYDNREILAIYDAEGNERKEW